MANISTWSTTAANNNAATPDGWPEGQAPSTVNNCGREMMAAVRTWFEDAQWINLGNTPTRIDNDTITIAGDVTATYTVGRRLKFVGATTGYATISASSYGAPNTTIDVVMDSGNIPTSLVSVAVGILTAASSAVPNSVAYFNAERITSSPTLPQNTITTAVFNQENSDLGGLYDNATGIFTAAVAGAYTFSAGIGLRNDDSVTATLNSVYFSKNNATAIGSGTRFNMSGFILGGTISASSNAFYASGAVTVVMAAGDTMRIKIDMGTVDASSLFGYLIGSYFTGAKVA